jgi:hypothetical protein
VNPPIGSPDLWSDWFPENLIPEILKLLVDSWQCLMKHPTKRPSPKDLEVPITRIFRETIRKEKNKKEIPVIVQREIPVDDPKSFEELGRIDLIFIHGHREDVYLAFECKRLNILNTSKTYANTGGYSGSEGMGRFFTGKYATGLDRGGMIGYVMDGNIESASERIKKSIVSKEDLKLTKKEIEISCHSPEGWNIFESKHKQNSSEFVMYHLLLPV